MSPKLGLFQTGALAALLAAPHGGNAAPVPAEPSPAPPDAFVVRGVIGRPPQEAKERVAAALAALGCWQPPAGKPPLCRIEALTRREVTIGLRLLSPLNVFPPEESQLGASNLLQTAAALEIADRDIRELAATLTGCGSWKRLPLFRRQERTVERILTLPPTSKRRDLPAPTRPYTATLRREAVTLLGDSTPPLLLYYLRYADDDKEQPANRFDVVTEIGLLDAAAVPDLIRLLPPLRLFAEPALDDIAGGKGSQLAPAERTAARLLAGQDFDGKRSLFQAWHRNRKPPPPP